MKEWERVLGRHVEELEPGFGDRVGPDFWAWYEENAYWMDFNIKAPGGNEFKKWERWRYKRFKNRARILVKDWIDKHGPPPKSEKMSVLFVRKGKRKMDYDNLVFAGKPWMDVLQEKMLMQHEDPFEDVLVARPVISDDSPEVCAMSHLQETGPTYMVSIYLLPLGNTT